METSDEITRNSWFIIQRVYYLAVENVINVLFLKWTCSGCGLGNVIDFYVNKCGGYAQ
jgi:hypothetical protein